jgi:hypothetical protein
LRLSNRFGDAPLHFTAVYVARPVSSNSDKIVPGSDKALTFSGAAEVMIRSHADYLSDPVTFPVNALSDLAITLRIDAPTSRADWPSRFPCDLVFQHMATSWPPPNFPTQNQ